MRTSDDGLLAQPQVRLFVLLETVVFSHPHSICLCSTFARVFPSHSRHFPLKNHHLVPMDITLGLFFSSIRSFLCFITSNFIYPLLQSHSFTYNVSHSHCDYRSLNFITIKYHYLISYLIFFLMILFDIQAYQYIILTFVFVSPFLQIIRINNQHRLFLCTLS